MTYKNPKQFYFTYVHRTSFESVPQRHNNDEKLFTAFFALITTMTDTSTISTEIIERQIQNENVTLPTVHETDETHSELVDGNDVDGDKNNTENGEVRHDVAEEEEDWTIQRDIYKYEGDNAYRKQQYHSAIHYYTMALSLDPNNGTILCNRSATYLKIQYYSKALYDAQQCLPTMGNKGKCRYATALQSLHRYEDAIQQYQSIINDDPTYHAAVVGLQYCKEQIKKNQPVDEPPEKVVEETIQPTKMNERISDKQGEEEESTDDLDDFFNDVEEVVMKTVHTTNPDVTTEVHGDDGTTTTTATDAILLHKKELGTVPEQVERLTKHNYFWYNLNPFHVLDLPYTATTIDISRRYKALSLLLHPDRFRTNDISSKNTDTTITKEQVQLAYDQVLIAKAALDNEDKCKHIRDLVEQGMNQGKLDYQKQQQEKKMVGGTAATADNNEMTLIEYQNRAIYRIFATIEYTRQQVIERERSFFQKEQESSDHIINKERNSRTHDQAWQQSDRVDTRIDDWRSFQSKSKKAKKNA
jgi:curved DNA-binding protein CbpA